MEAAQKKNQFAVGTLGLSFVGLGLSAYAAYHHSLLKIAGETDAICNINSKLNCDQVASSPYSELFNVPVAIFGVGFFLSLIVMAATLLVGHKSEKENAPALVPLIGIGVLVSIVLGAISTFAVKVWCVICLGVYAVCLLLAVWALINKAIFRQYSFKMKVIGNGLTTALGAVAVVVILYNFLGPQPTPGSRRSKVAQELQNKEGADASLMLGPPVQLTINKSPYSGLGEDFRKGNDAARLVLVEFSDLQCPACADFHKTVEELSRQMGDKLLVVFRNFPLSSTCNRSVERDLHQHACLMAKLARCAGQYGKFWDYARLAYEGQKGVDAEKARDWAKKVGLNADQIKTCEASSDISAKISDDIALGNQIGVEGTPAIYINGRKYLGDRDLESIKAVLGKLE